MYLDRTFWTATWRLALRPTSPFGSVPRAAVGGGSCHLLDRRCPLRPTITFSAVGLDSHPIPEVILPLSLWTATTYQRRLVDGQLFDVQLLDSHLLWEQLLDSSLLDVQFLDSSLETRSANKVGVRNGSDWAAGTVSWSWSGEFALVLTFTTTRGTRCAAADRRHCTTRVLRNRRRFWRQAFRRGDHRAFPPERPPFDHSG